MSAYEDINSALTAIEDRLLAKPGPSDAEQLLLAKKYDELHAAMGELAAGRLAQRVDEVAAAAARLRDIVRGANTDPLADGTLSSLPEK
jgi:hypothetical protein